MTEKDEYKPEETKLREITITLVQHQYLLDVLVRGHHGRNYNSVLETVLQLGIDELIRREEIARRRDILWQTEPPPKKPGSRRPDPGSGDASPPPA